MSWFKIQVNISTLIENIKCDSSNWISIVCIQNEFLFLNIYYYGKYVSLGPLLTWVWYIYTLSLLSNSLLMFPNLLYKFSPWKLNPLYTLILFITSPYFRFNGFVNLGLTHLQKVMPWKKESPYLTIYLTFHKTIPHFNVSSTWMVHLVLTCLAFGYPIMDKFMSHLNGKNIDVLE